ncbi:hypothetical protein L6164_017479 [Bauhinia variegata]|uniref:Uncharacterized protein n=1 Tax=Bauhinia variegata TaxID=167791 RepID=A0ACB9N9J7_BAUVA|nr:hypothetical protein L6164_017479 [Bauhinia variegata]
MSSQKQIGSSLGYGNKSWSGNSSQSQNSGGSSIGSNLGYANLNKKGLVSYCSELSDSENCDNLRSKHRRKKLVQFNLSEKWMHKLWIQQILALKTRGLVQATIIHPPLIYCKIQGRVETNTSTYVFPFTYMH